MDGISGRLPFGDSAANFTRWGNLVQPSPRRLRRFPYRQDRGSQYSPERWGVSIDGRRVVENLSRVEEWHGFLRGLVAFLGFRQKILLVYRPARHAGVTNYSATTPSTRDGVPGFMCCSSALLKLRHHFWTAVCGRRIPSGFRLRCCADLEASLP